MEDLVKKMEAHYEELVKEKKITHINESYAYKLACVFVEAQLNNLLKTAVSGRSEQFYCFDKECKGEEICDKQCGACSLTKYSQ